MFKWFGQVRLLLRDSWITSSVISMIALIIHAELSIEAIFLVIGIAMGYTLAYGLNDYFDSEEDRLNQNKVHRNYFVNNRLTKSIAILVITGVLVIALTIFVSYGQKGYYVYFLSLFILIAYSSKPLKLRNRPPFDIIVHSLFIISYPYFLILFLLEIRWIVTDYIFMGIFIIGSTIIQFENQIRDFDENDKTIVNTTNNLGVDKSQIIVKLLNLVLLILSVIAFILIDEIIILLPYAIIYSPIILYRFFAKPGTVRPETMIRKVIIASAIYSVGLIVYLYFR